MANTRGRRLREAREKRFKSARAAALAFGIPVSTYGAHERAQLPGGRDYGPEEAEAYARRLGVTAEWLLTGYGTESGQLPHSRAKFSSGRLRVIGYVGSGAIVHLYEVDPKQIEQIDSKLLLPDSTVALDIRDPSMMGLLLRGWVLIYGSEQRRATPELTGKLCVVAYEDGRIKVQIWNNEEVGIRWVAAIEAIIPR